MKQRLSSRELEEDYEAAAAAAARARARGFSKLSKFMKVIGRGITTSSTTPPPPPPPPYHKIHNSLLRGGRLPERQSSSSAITELSNLGRRTMELPNQEEVVPQHQSQPPPPPPISSSSSSNRMYTSAITELSNLRRRTMELPNQEEVEPQHQEQPPPRSNNRMYTCKTCGRQFETFQALGGHRASHKMKLVGDGSNQHFQYKAKLHRCSICQKGYQTGQALGGHMRKHRELLDNQRLAIAAAEAASNVHHQNVNNRDAADQQSNALRWAQMNAAAIFQYSQRRYNNAPPHPPAEAREEEILREKVPTRRGINFDLNLDVLENEELGLGTDDE